MQKTIWTAVSSTRRCFVASTPPLRYVRRPGGECTRRGSGPLQAPPPGARDPWPQECGLFSVSICAVLAGTHSTQSRLFADGSWLGALLWPGRHAEHLVSRARSGAGSLLLGLDHSVAAVTSTALSLTSVSSRPTHQYYEAFVASGVNQIKDLLHVAREDLQKLVSLPGHRKKMELAIKSLRGEVRVLPVAWRVGLPDQRSPLTPRPSAAGPDL